jgi:hypothetical protein
VTKNVPGFPEWGTVSLIEPSPFDAATAYLVVDAHRLDDMRPYLWKTSDYGKSWKRITKGLPEDVYLHAVREDPKHRGLLFLGTERGLMISPDDGASWQPLRLGLPTVAVHDLVVKDNDLVLATMGRSLWIFDDITPFREISPEVREEAVHLFTPQPATRWRVRSEWHTDEDAKEPGTADNPPRGALVYYYLKAKPKDEIKLEILDQQGAVIRTLNSTPEPAEYAPDDPDEPKDAPKPELAVDSGVHRAVWDLRYEGAEKIKPGKLDGGSPEDGPVALPGAYTVRLVVDGKSLTAPLTVVPDPRVKLTPQALADQLRFGLELRDQITRVTGLVNEIRSLRKQLAVRSELWKGEPKAANLVSDAQALTVKLDTLEARVHNPRAEVVYDILAQRGGAKLYSRLAPLYTSVVEADGAPTQGMREVYAMLKKELDGIDGEFRGLVSGDLAALNRTARELNLGDVLVPGGTAPGR